VRHLARASLALTLLASCSHERPRAPGLLATAIYDLSEDARFFDAPFPSDARRTSDGRPDFSGFPNPGKLELANQLVRLATGTLDGFDPHGAIYFLFDRPLPFRALPPEPNTLDHPGIQLVDVDPNSPEQGRRFPVWVRTSTRHDGVRPANLLQLLPVPGTALRQGTTYAAVVDVDVDDDGVVDLGQPRALRELFTGLGDARWTNALGPLIDNAGDLGIDLSHVAAATVFTTGHPAARLQAWVDAAAAGPAPKLIGLERDRDYPSYVVLKGKVRLPVYQQGDPPYFMGGGGISTDERGMPIQQGEVDAPFVLSIPKGPVPEGGLRHYFYVHGTGGKATQAIDRGYRTPDTPPAPGSGIAGWVAPLGYATSCVAGAFSPDRIGWRAVDGYGAYAFFNPLAMRDNFAQMVLEQVLFMRLLEELEIDPKLVPEAEGKLTFAKEARIVGGQSLGSYLSGMLAGLTGSFDAAILTGAGGTWIEFGFGPKDPVDLAALLDLLIPPQGERLDHHHPFITLFQNAVGPADNTHYTPRILRRPPPSAERIPHVLVIQGQHDRQVPVNLQRALTLSTGVDLAGPDVGLTPDAQLLPVLSFGGLRQLTLPVQGNVDTRLGPRTAVTRRYMEDGLVDGHLVVFQVPEAQRALLEFVEDIRDGRVPTVR
jgi:hypothetical protein